MNDINAKSLLDEVRKVVSISFLAALLAYGIVMLERVGGALSAVLGAVCFFLVIRLLYLASVAPKLSEAAKVREGDADISQSSKSNDPRDPISRDNSSFF